MGTGAAGRCGIGASRLRVEPIHLLPSRPCSSRRGPRSKDGRCNSREKASNAGAKSIARTSPFLEFAIPGNGVEGSISKKSRPCPFRQSWGRPRLWHVGCFQATRLNAGKEREMPLSISRVSVGATGRTRSCARFSWTWAPRRARSGPHRSRLHAQRGLGSRPRGRRPHQVRPLRLGDPDRATVTRASASCSRARTSRRRVLQARGPQAGLGVRPVRRKPHPHAHRLGEAFEDAVWDLLRHEDMRPVQVRFGVWREGPDAMKFVCKVEYSSAARVPWSWWSARAHAAGPGRRAGSAPCSGGSARPSSPVRCARCGRRPRAAAAPRARSAPRRDDGHRQGTAARDLSRRRASPPTVDRTSGAIAPHGCRVAPCPRPGAARPRQDPAPPLRSTQALLSRIQPQGGRRRSSPTGRPPAARSATTT